MDSKEIEMLTMMVSERRDFRQKLWRECLRNSKEANVVRLEWTNVGIVGEVIRKVPRVEMVVSVCKSLTFFYFLEKVMSFDKEQSWFNSCSHPRLPESWGWWGDSHAGTWMMSIYIRDSKYKVPKQGKVFNVFKE